MTNTYTIPPEPDSYPADISAPQSQFVALGNFGDFEVEFELIGSMMRRGSIFDDISAEINVEFFHNSSCWDIFSAMQKVREHGLILDSVTVADQLERDGTLASIKYDCFTSRAAIGAIREKGNPKSVSSYVEIVKDYWAKRQIDYLSQTLVTQARNGRRASDILADARIKFDELDIFGGQVSSRTYNSKQLASELYDHVEKASKGEIKGCKTGFVDLDKVVTMMGGDLVVFGGRPGQGKSSLLDSIAMQTIKLYGKKVALFSLEMSKTQVMARLASHICSVPSNRLLNGDLQDFEWPLFTSAIEYIEKSPIFINDQSGLSIPQMRKETRRIARELGGLDLIILDYVQLMKASRRHKNRNEEIGEITKGLKEIGKDFDVPVLAAAQMSRAVEQRSEKRPILSDLRESGDLENDSDIVIFIYRPNQYEKDTEKQSATELIIAKHRNGPVGSIDLVFRGELAKFESAAVRTFKPK